MIGQTSPTLPSPARRPGGLGASVPLPENARFSGAEAAVATAAKSGAKSAAGKLKIANAIMNTVGKWEMKQVGNLSSYDIASRSMTLFGWYIPQGITAFKENRHPIENKRLTIEYILLAGVNDSPEHGHQLGKLLQGLKCNVNLIPYNPIGDSYGFKRPSNNACHRFKDVVSSYGKKVTIRVERGVDIAAACGQLANKVQGESADIGQKIGCC